MYMLRSRTTICTQLSAVAYIWGMLMNWCLSSQVGYFLSVIRRAWKKSMKVMETSTLYLKGAFLSNGTSSLKLLLTKELDLKRNCNNMKVSISE